MQVGFGVAGWESVLPLLDFTLRPIGTFIPWVDLELPATGCSSDTPLENLTALFGYEENPIWIHTGTKLEGTISWASPTLTTLWTPLLQKSELASSPLEKKCPQILRECLQIQRVNHVSDPQLEENRKQGKKNIKVNRKLLIPWNGN